MIDVPEFGKTDLSKHMYALAASGHPRAKELRDKARAFDEASSEFADAKKILGTWARARRCYCECTGQPLI